MTRAGPGPGQGPCSIPLTREKVHVILDHVESKPAAVVGKPATQSPICAASLRSRAVPASEQHAPYPNPGKPASKSTPTIPPRRVGRGSGWMRPRGPPCTALVTECSDTSDKCVLIQPRRPRSQGAARATASILFRQQNPLFRHFLFIFAVGSLFRHLFLPHTPSLL